MVQHKYVYDADNMFENVNSVTFRLFLINAVQIVPLATFQQRCIVRYMQYWVTTLSINGLDNFLDMVD